MKNKKQDLLILILVIALMVAFAKINDLESDVRMLQRDLSNNVSNLETRVNSIYENVDTFLKQEASLLSGVEYQYGALDPDTQQVDILLKILPKEVTDDTVLRVSLGDTVSQLERSGNAFEGSIPVSLLSRRSSCC